LWIPSKIEEKNIAKINKIEPKENNSLVNSSLVMARTYNSHFKIPCFSGHKDDLATFLKSCDYFYKKINKSEEEDFIEFIGTRLDQKSLIFFE
jgi:hypothetical protein